MIDNLDLLYENSDCSPSRQYVFRPFQDSNFKDIDVVFLGYEPYHCLTETDSSACGFSFLSDYGYASQEVKAIFNELRKDVISYRYTKYKTYDYKKWTQRTLMLNTSLTTEKGLPGSHTAFWSKFTEQLLRGLSKEKPDMVYILLGSSIQKYKKFISNGHFVEAPYPLSEGFEDSKIFSRTNEILIELGKEKIDW